jgi:hypothetical protein
MTIIENRVITAKKEITLVKPTIQELMQAYIDTYKQIHMCESDDSKLIEEYEQIWQDAIRKNKRFLSVQDHADFDISNFNKLISSIYLNGAKHFNMQLFLGSLVENYEDDDEDCVKLNDLDNWETVSGISGDYLHPLTCSVNFLDVSTKAFNCDTVGCIAGFAMANAFDWREDLVKEVAKYGGGQKELFEHIACNFLNIPIKYGEKLFYGKENSFWHYLYFIYQDYSKSSELKVFESLKMENLYDENEDVDMSSINYKMAVKVLELVRDGHLVLDGSDEARITTNYARIINEDNINNGGYWSKRV